MSGAAVVSSAASKVSVSVTPFTDATVSDGTVVSGVALVTDREAKLATLLPAVSLSGFAPGSA